MRVRLRLTYKLSCVHIQSPTKLRCSKHLSTFNPPYTYESHHRVGRRQQVKSDKVGTNFIWQRRCRWVAVGSKRHQEKGWMRRMSRRMIISERHNPNSLCNLPAYTHVHMALYLLLDLGATNAYELLESSSSSHRSSLHSCTNSCRSGMANIEPAGTTNRLGYTTSRGCRRMCCSALL